ncbi:hypothetical protein [Clavibacter michiganensis]
MVANLGRAYVPMPPGRVIVASEPLSGTVLPPDVAVWIAAE